MTWKIGQKIVCIKKGLWFRSVDPKYDDYGPKYGEVCEIEYVNSPYLHIKEYPTCQITGLQVRFHESRFRPLLGDSAKSELISSFKEVTETSDAPIKSPKPETV